MPRLDAAMVQSVDDPILGKIDHPESNNVVGSPHEKHTISKPSALDTERFPGCPTPASGIADWTVESGFTTLDIICLNIPLISGGFPEVALPLPVLGVIGTVDGIPVYIGLSLVTIGVPQDLTNGGPVSPQFTVWSNMLCANTSSRVGSFRDTVRTIATGTVGSIPGLPGIVGKPSVTAKDS